MASYKKILMVWICAALFVKWTAAPGGAALFRHRKRAKNQQVSDNNKNIVQGINKAQQS